MSRFIPSPAHSQPALSIPLRSMAAGLSQCQKLYSIRYCQEETRPGLQWRAGTGSLHIMYLPALAQVFPHILQPGVSFQMCFLHSSATWMVGRRCSAEASWCLFTAFLLPKLTAFSSQTWHFCMLLQTVYWAWGFSLSESMAAIFN